MEGEDHHQDPQRKPKSHCVRLQLELVQYQAVQDKTKKRKSKRNPDSFLELWELSCKALLLGLDLQWPTKQSEVPWEETLKDSKRTKKPQSDRAKPLASSKQKT